MKVLENNARVAEIEARLTKYSYLSRKSLPGAADGRVFQALEQTKKYPDRKLSPYFYHWYILMRQFSANSMSKWIADEIYSEGDDTVIIEFVKYNAARKDSLLGTIPVVQQSQVHAECDPKTGKCEPQAEDYELEILPSCDPSQIIETLKKQLEQYTLKFEIKQEGDKQIVRIFCKTEANKWLQLKNKVSQFTSCTEYVGMGSKKGKWLKNSTQDPSGP